MAVLKKKTGKASKKKAKKRPAVTNERARNSRRAIDKQFVAAVRASRPDFEAAQRALDAGADINCPVDFDTVLIEALRESKHEVVEWLLAQPTIDIHQAGRYDSPLNAALMGVARTNDRRWVDALIERKADASNVNMFGQSALTTCIQFFGSEVAWLAYTMTQATIDPVAARREKRWRPINVALERDAKPAFFMLRERGVELDHPVTAAADAGAVNILEQLLASKHGEPLGRALANAKNASVARVLLNAKEDINAADDDGYSALHNAIASADLELTRLLLERGADVAVGHKGDAALFALTTPSSVEVAELLQAHGVDWTVRNHYGQSLVEACDEMIDVVGGSKIRGGGRLINKFREDVAGIAKDLQAMHAWLKTRVP